MFKRVKTGIQALDSLMGGGFVEGSANLVTGETGSGKTLFAAQFVWHGLQKGEPGVFVTLEENLNDIKEDARAFGWDFEKYEKKGLLKLLYHDPAQVNNISTVVMNELDKLRATRIAIDSITVMALNIGNVAQVRRKLFSLINALKSQKGVTSVITSEIPEGSKGLSRFSVEEYVVDSIILLNYLGVGDEYNRSLAIRKMRRTNHGKDVYPFEITARGLVVKKASM